MTTTETSRMSDVPLSEQRKRPEAVWKLTFPGNGSDSRISTGSGFGLTRGSGCGVTVTSRRIPVSAIPPGPSPRRLISYRPGASKTNACSMSVLGTGGALCQSDSPLRRHRQVNVFTTPRVIAALAATVSGTMPADGV